MSPHGAGCGEGQVGAQPSAACPHPRLSVCVCLSLGPSLCPRTSHPSFPQSGRSWGHTPGSASCCPHGPLGGPQAWGDTLGLATVAALPHPIWLPAAACSPPLLLLMWQPKCPHVPVPPCAHVPSATASLAHVCLSPAWGWCCPGPTPWTLSPSSLPSRGQLGWHRGCPELCMGCRECHGEQLGWHRGCSVLQMRCRGWQKGTWGGTGDAQGGYQTVQVGTGDT